MAGTVAPNFWARKRRLRSEKSGKKPPKDQDQARRELSLAMAQFTGHRKEKIWRHNREHVPLFVVDIGHSEGVGRSDVDNVEFRARLLTGIRVTTTVTIHGLPILTRM